MDKETFLKESLWYFHGVFQQVDENLPDGAWRCMHENLAEQTIDSCCRDLKLKKPKGIDGNDITHYYMNHKDGIQNQLMKAKAKLWIDANVWDGEDRIGCKGDSVLFNPDDLQELINDVIDYLYSKKQDTNRIDGE